jgi:hypothetical protein
MLPFEDSQNNFVKYTDQQGNLLSAIVRDGTIQVQGVEFTDGTTQTTAASGGSQPVSVVNLTAAQILALSTTPVVLVPAPGANQYIAPTVVIFQFIYGGTPFTGVVGANLQVGDPTSVAGNVSWFFLTQVGLLDQTTSQVSPAIVENAVIQVANATNAPLVINSSAASPTGGGDGSILRVITYYSVLSAT